MYALAVAHANDFAAPDEFVKIAGGLLLLLGFGTMVGPILAAQAMERLDAGRPLRLHRDRRIFSSPSTPSTECRSAPCRPGRSREVFQGLPLPQDRDAGESDHARSAGASENGDGTGDARRQRRREPDQVVLVTISCLALSGSLVQE